MRIRSSCVAYYFHKYRPVHRWPGKSVVARMCLCVCGLTAVSWSLVFSFSFKGLGLQHRVNPTAFIIPFSTVHTFSLCFSLRKSFLFFRKLSSNRNILRLGEDKRCVMTPSKFPCGSDPCKRFVLDRKKKEEIVVSLPTQRQEMCAGSIRQLINAIAISVGLSLTPFIAYTLTFFPRSLLSFFSLLLFGFIFSLFFDDE